MDRFVIVSSDCHASARPEEYTGYIEPRYREAYEKYRHEVESIMAIFEQGAEEGGRLFSSEAIAEYKENDAVDAAVAGGT